jgi:hypothetical protein
VSGRAGQLRKASSATGAGRIGRRPSELLRSAQAEAVLAW